MPSKRTQKSTYHELPHAQEYAKIWDQLPEEQKAQYKEMGEKMFETIDTVINTDEDSKIDPLANAAVHIDAGLKSGMHPSFLDSNDIEILKSIYGAKWYERYGYDETDLEL